MQIEYWDNFLQCIFMNKLLQYIPNNGCLEIEWEKEKEEGSINLISKR